MFYILFALFAASLFGIGAVSIYGYDGILQNPWVDYVTWWLIGSGVVLALLDDSTALRCRFCPRTWQLPLLCPRTTCP